MFGQLPNWPLAQSDRRIGKTDTPLWPIAQATKSVSVLLLDRTVRWLNNSVCRHYRTL